MNVNRHVEVTLHVFEQLPQNASGRTNTTLHVFHGPQLDELATLNVMVLSTATKFAAPPPHVCQHMDSELAGTSVMTVVAACACFLKWQLAYPHRYANCHLRNRAQSTSTRACVWQKRAL